MRDVTHWVLSDKLMQMLEWPLPTLQNVGAIASPKIFPLRCGKGGPVGVIDLLAFVGKDITSWRLSLAAFHSSLPPYSGGFSEIPPPGYLGWEESFSLPSL